MASKKILVDTNVLISAIIGQYSFPYKIFNELIGTGVFLLCFSDALLQEYKSVSSREKFNKYPGFKKNAAALISSIELIGIKVNPTQKIEIIKDSFDNHLLELAMEAKAFSIVTGNTNDFDFQDFQGIKILSPKEFYEMATMEKE